MGLEAVSYVTLVEPKTASRSRESESHWRPEFAASQPFTNKPDVPAHLARRDGYTGRLCCSKAGTS